MEKSYKNGISDATPILRVGGYTLFYNLCCWGNTKKLLIKFYTLYDTLVGDQNLNGAQLSYPSSSMRFFIGNRVGFRCALKRAMRISSNLQIGF